MSEDNAILIALLRRVSRIEDALGINEEKSDDVKFDILTQKMDDLLQAIKKQSSTQVIPSPS